MDMTQPYIIFFRGLDGLIDEAAAERLAKNRGCVAVFFLFVDVDVAVQHVANNAAAPYHVVGFSRGAAPDIMGGFMREVREDHRRLPEDIMTVGLYGESAHSFTPRYRDPVLECVNFLDSSGQYHVNEHDDVHYRNLGAHVPHIGPGSGMELVADMFADGKNPLVPQVAASSSPQPPVIPAAPLSQFPSSNDAGKPTILKQRG